MPLEALKLALYKRLPRSLQVRAVRLATPNFTVGAMGLLTMTGGELLLTQPSYRDGWLPPGGLLQRGETATEGLSREVSEELGLQITFAEPHRVVLDPRRQAVTFVCVGTVPLGTAPTSQSRELRDVGWFPLEALPPLPNDFHEGIPAADLATVRRAGNRSAGPRPPAGS